jgi:hypothetical protein
MGQHELCFGATWVNPPTRVAFCSVFLPGGRFAAASVALAMVAVLVPDRANAINPTPTLAAYFFDDDDESRSLIEGLDASAAEAAGENGHDDQEEVEEEEEGVRIYLEEVFLGTIVYPQEKGELQLTWGYFDGVEADDNRQFLFELEYGITDRLQIGFEVPVDFLRDEEPFDGVTNLGLELYYNFLNDPCRGRAYGLGFEVGFPTDSPEDEPRAWVYEPFFVAYQDFCDFALNFSAAIEVEDPLAEEDTTTTGELAWAAFRTRGRCTQLLELGLEIGEEETPLRIAPGLYWRPWDEGVDLAVSLPIGLNADAPEIGVFLMAVWEREWNK